MNGHCTDAIAAAQAIPEAHGGRAYARGRRRAFARHVAEMMIAMVAGMVVLGAAVQGALALAGASLSGAPVAVAAAVMAVNMTVPMVAWMARRGHSARDSAEMAGSMIAPTALAVALYWLGAMGEHGVMVVQHAVMIPAMVGVMLWRYDRYSH